MADQPNDQDNDSNDGCDLSKLDKDDPNDNTAHMAHIAVSAFACLLSKALLTTFVAAFIVFRAFGIDRFAGIIG